MSVQGGPEIVDTNLILYLDAANQKSYSGSGTTWLDLSERKNNATLNNITYNSANGGSMVFNGTNAYITNPLSDPGSMPITFDFWINSDSSSPVGIFDTSPNQTNVLRNFDVGQVEWWADSPEVNLGISASTWTNIIIQYSFLTNRIITYYKDGNLVSTTTGSTTATYSWTALRFGDINNGVSGRYAGKMASIKIYNKSLTPNEVKQNYNAIRGRFGL